MEPLRQWIDHLIIDNDRNLHEKCLEDFFQKTYDHYRLQSQTPEGAYGLMDLETTRQELDQWVETLKPILEKMISGQKDSYHSMCVGETTDHFSILSEKLNVLRFSQLQISVSTFDTFNNPVCRDVEIHGRLPWLWKDDTGVWHSLILTGSGKKPAAKPDRYLLEPVLTYFVAFCMESGKDLFNKSPITFHVVYQNGIQSWTCQVTAGEALDYIKKLVAQYLNPHMRQWLPYDAVVDAAGDLGKICMSDDLEVCKEDFMLKLSAALSETEDSLVLLSDPEIGSHALQESCSRFGIFFKNLQVKL